jgi:site-specific DNA-methyltransferase (adenine-specific)/modification methylase
VLDNAFGSGSFLVAAALEGRSYVGIERNQDVHLFKKVQVDYVGVARERIKDIAAKNEDEITMRKRAIS